MGGKSLHASWISPYIPSNIKTYVEVFGGAMWVYWESNKVPVETNVYNDFNRHLVNVFACGSRDPAHFKEILETYYMDMHNAELFIEYRDEVFSIYGTEFVIPDFPLAAKYMLLQLQTYVGGNNLTKDSKIYIETKHKPKFHIFTEKFGARKYLKKLERLTVENMDCREVINKYDSENTFFYIDPPYYDLGEKYYTEASFTHDDHVELLELMKQTKGRWALSYYPFDLLEEILPRDKYTWHEEKTYSNNSPSEERGKVERTELLVMNYKTGLSFL